MRYKNVNDMQKTPIKKKKRMKPTRRSQKCWRAATVFAVQGIDGEDLELWSNIAHFCLVNRLWHPINFQKI